MPRPLDQWGEQVGSPNRTTLALLWTTGALLAGGDNAVSGWLNVSDRNVLRIGRTSSGSPGYAFEIDWSRDGVAVDFAETVAVADNTTIEKPIASLFARLRVRNTDAVAAFTAHRTVVVTR